MFAYNRNYEELQAPPPPSDDNMSKDASEFIEGDTLSNRYKVFPVDYLIKRLLDYGEEQGQSRVRQVAKWGITTTENILRALLKHQCDKIAW